MTMTKLSDLKSSREIAATESRDPGVAAELERTSVAEQVALLVTTYRVEHGLTQTGLAELLGMHQPAIARLEAGTHEPSLATLARLSSALGIRLDVHIAPDSMVLESA
jgi:ribosome-binding protein aMBF1 (putative translation factor)